MSEEKNNDKNYVNEVVWKDYKAGDKVEGIVVDILENMGEYGNRIYKIRTDNAFVAVWGSKDLDKKMDKLKVSAGMNIEITFNGLIRTDNGFDMKDFTVIVLD
ncbi:hypothetical protein [Methanosphaera stadtmanae]|uniref:hypothetical protein n=1 Tax=Methanosphaera stadtmanae TaxID=2317 RepID=UPI002596A73E|nr:hypothetical protein [Methanosphaera stadtmanae]